MDGKRRDMLTAEEIKQHPGCDVCIDGEYYATIDQVMDNERNRKKKLYDKKQKNKKSFYDAVDDLED